MGFCFGGAEFVDNTQTEFQFIDAFVKSSDLGDSSVVWLNGDSSITARYAKDYFETVLERWGASPAFSDSVDAATTNYMFSYVETVLENVQTNTGYADGFLDGSYHNQVLENVPAGDWTGDPFYPTISEEMTAAEDDSSFTATTSTSVFEIIDSLLNTADVAKRSFPTSLVELFEMAETLLATITDGVTPDSYNELLFDGATIAGFTTYGDLVAVLEEVTLAASLTVKSISTILETLNFNDTTTGAREILLLLLEDFEVQEAIKTAFPKTVAETMTFDDLLTTLTGILVTVVDGVTYDHSTIHQAFLNASAESGITLVDLLKLIDLIAEAVGLADTLDVHKLIQVSTPEFFTFDEDVSARASIFVLTEEDLDVDGLTLPQLISQGLIEDNIEFMISDDQLGLEYSAWVMHPENDAAISNYDFEFNYSTTFGQDSLLANDEGLYKFGGCADEGADILSTITTASLDFGTTNLKNMNKMYLETDSNKLTLVARVENRYEARYRMNHRDDFLGLRMIELGKGLKGYLWQFKLQNVDNSEFDIDSIELLPMVLRRKR